jgi:hypothetical protein
MVENQTMTAPRLTQSTAQMVALVLGAIGLLTFSSGCVGAPDETTDTPESLGAAAQAWEGAAGIVSYANPVPYGVNVGLTHVAYPDGVFNLRYGIAGGSYTTLGGYSGAFNLTGLTPYAPYNIYARECASGAIGYGYSAATNCGAWAPVPTPFVPGASAFGPWIYGASASAVALSGAYAAGYTTVAGAQVGVPLCSAYVGGASAAQYIGAWDNGACYYAAGGVAYNTANAYVLSGVPSYANWVPYSPTLAANVLYAGYAYGAPIAACRAACATGYVTGYASAGSCITGYGGAYNAVPLSSAYVLPVAP